MENKLKTKGLPKQYSVKQKVETESINLSQLETEDAMGENISQEDIKKINVLENSTLKNEESLKGPERSKFNFRFIQLGEMFEECETGMRGYGIPFLEVKNGEDQTEVIIEVSVDENEDFEDGEFLSFTVRDDEIGKAGVYRDKIASFFGWEKLKLNGCTMIDNSGGENEYDNGLENHFKMFWFKRGKISLFDQDCEEIHLVAPSSTAVCYTMNVSRSV